MKLINLVEDTFLVWCLECSIFLYKNYPCIIKCEQQYHHVLWPLLNCCSLLHIGPLMAKFTIALREIATYKEVLRSQVMVSLFFYHFTLPMVLLNLSWSPDCSIGMLRWDNLGSNYDNLTLVLGWIFGFILFVYVLGNAEPPWCCSAFKWSKLTHVKSPFCSFGSFVVDVVGCEPWMLLILHPLGPLIGRRS